MVRNLRPASRLKRCAAAAAAVAFVLLAWAFPAEAQVIDRDRFEFSFSEDTELCGIAVHQETEVSGREHVRVGKGKTASAFFVHVNYRYTDVFTNPANGRVLVIEGHAVFQETKATRVNGTIFRFTAVEAGQPFVLRDVSGRVVLRDRGAIRTTILFDTLGDATPGGEVLEVISERLSGPHPGFDEDVFCAAVVELIG